MTRCARASTTALDAAAYSVSTLGSLRRLNSLLAKLTDLVETNDIAGFVDIYQQVCDLYPASATSCPTHEGVFTRCSGITELENMKDLVICLNKPSTATRGFGLYTTITSENGKLTLDTPRATASAIRSTTVPAPSPRMTSRAGWSSARLTLQGHAAVAHDCRYDLIRWIASPISTLYWYGPTPASNTACGNGPSVRHERHDLLSQHRDDARSSCRCCIISRRSRYDRRDHAVYRTSRPTGIGPRLPGHRGPASWTARRPAFRQTSPSRASERALLMRYAARPALRAATRLPICRVCRRRQRLGWSARRHGRCGGARPVGGTQDRSGLVAAAGRERDARRDRRRSGALRAQRGHLL